MPTIALGSQTHSNSALEEAKSILGYFLKNQIYCHDYFKYSYRERTKNAFYLSSQNWGDFTFYPNNWGDMWPLISVS